MLSQTSEYALRAMTCLAFAPDQLTTTPTLAELTKVPANYLAKVLQSLAQSGLIVGRRGVGGGYKLAKPAEDVSLLAIINAIDPIERPQAAEGDDTLSPALVPLHRKLGQASSMLIRHFEGTSLRDLVDENESNDSDPQQSGPAPTVLAASRGQTAPRANNGVNSSVSPAGPLQSPMSNAG